MIRHIYIYIYIYIYVYTYQALATHTLEKGDLTEADEVRTAAAYISLLFS